MEHPLDEGGNTRRNFFKIAAATTAGLSIGPAAFTSAKEKQFEPGGTIYSFVNNTLSLCAPERAPLRVAANHGGLNLLQ